MPWTAGIAPERNDKPYALALQSPVGSTSQLSESGSELMKTLAAQISNLFVKDGGELFSARACDCMVHEGRVTLRGKI
jgi:hypothetical protein